MLGQDRLNEWMLISMSLCHKMSLCLQDNSDCCHFGFNQTRPRTKFCEQQFADILSLSLVLYRSTSIYTCGRRWYWRSVTGDTGQWKTFHTPRYCKDYMFFYWIWFCNMRKYHVLQNLFVVRDPWLGVFVFIFLYSQSVFGMHVWARHVTEKGNVYQDLCTVASKQVIGTKLAKKSFASHPGLVWRLPCQISHCYTHSRHGALWLRRLHYITCHLADAFNPKRLTVD